MKKAFFIGIGGIGMSALAQMLAHDGVEVSGSDRDPNQKVHDMLAAQGISVKVGNSSDNVPADADAVIYSDAVVEGSEGFVERLRARELGIKEQSYFEALGEVSKNKRTIAIAGTHGKTTTTGMLAKILINAGASPTVIVGSILKDFNSNYVHGDSDLFVVEACEYRDHLLELSPEVLVINNLEWDHTDWFPSLAAVQETFKKAVAKVPKNGVIVTNPKNSNIAPLLRQGYAGQARIIDYEKEWEGEAPFSLLVPSEFNQHNARAAAAAAREIIPSLATETIRAALSDFHGTWRRFEYKGKTKNGTDIYDDYAHHPTAIKETLRALRALRASGKGKIFAVFQPHLFSRTKDLLNEFAGAFSDADEVFIAPIYAAREKNDHSVSSETLAERVRETGTHATAASVSDIVRALETEPSPNDTIITMGAGDIYKVADQIVAP